MYSSEEELCSYLINLSLKTSEERYKNYNDIDNPQNYIIPSKFIYKDPDMNIKIFEKFKDTKNPSKKVAERISDNCKIIVYNALNKLVKDNFDPPIVVLCGFDFYFDINKKKTNKCSILKENGYTIDTDEVEKILKLSSKDKWITTSYDFIVFGPKIGITIIEVRSSSYKRDKHFKLGNRHLPDNYKEGISILRSEDALKYIIKSLCEGKIDSSILEKLCIRKIIYTPNLSQKRYNEWVSSLSDENKTILDEKLSDIIQLFEEDSVPNDTNPPLYLRLKELFTENINLPLEIYNIIGLPLISMKTISIEDEK